MLLRKLSASEVEQVPGLLEDERKHTWWVGELRSPRPAGTYLIAATWKGKDGVVVVDTNGDGTLAGEKRASIRRGGKYVCELLVSVDKKRKVNLKARFSFRIFRGGKTHLVRVDFPVCWRGELKVDGKSLGFYLIDANANGVLGDYLKERFRHGDLFVREELAAAGVFRASMPLVPIVYFAGSYFRIEVDPAGEKVVFKKVSPGLGKVRIKAAAGKYGYRLHLICVGKFARQVAAPTTGEPLVIELPAGRYDILSLELWLEDEEGRGLSASVASGEALLRGKTEAGG
jgi:hypothetical protein